MKRRKKSHFFLYFIICLLSFLLSFIFFSTYNAVIIPDDDEVLEYPYPPNDYDYNYLSHDGYYTYEDENYESLVGIDVSYYQKEIDFEKVKAAGIDFVYIRLGYRESRNGEVALDPYFKQNYQNAKKAKLLVGVYFFSAMINEEEAYEDFKFVYNECKHLDLDLPIALDYEESSLPEGRQNNLSGEERTNNALVFLKNMKKKKVDVCLYTNYKWLNEYYDLSKILNYNIWYAHYGIDEPIFPYRFFTWQYSCTGKVDGVNGDVDLNILFKKKD